MKYQPGDVVYIRSAQISGAVPCTVLDGDPAREADENGKGAKPITYGLVMVQKDGANVLTFHMPEHALVGVAELQ